MDLISKNIKNNYHLFLDIDGVLTTTQQYYSNSKKWNDIYNRYRFDFKCVKVFNIILEKTKPIIILSSDWQFDYSFEMLNKIFEINEVNCRITDVTGSTWGSKFTSLSQLEECRAYDILQYVEKHNIKKFLAIDDLNLNPWMPEKTFIHTSKANEGIKQCGIKDKILNILLNK